MQILCAVGFQYNVYLLFVGYVLTHIINDMLIGTNGPDFDDILIKLV